MGRMHRKQEAQDGKSIGDTLSSIARTKKRLKTVAGLSVWDADDTPRNARENIVEEWQETIMRQSELAQTMRVHVDEQIKNLQQQTIHRKAQESALFCSQAKALKIRAQAQSSEARVQRLANELKRVYHSLPETIQKK